MVDQRTVVEMRESVSRAATQKRRAFRTALAPPLTARLTGEDAPARNNGCHEGQCVWRLVAG
jgi:hypothetical protein